jgi:A/G-specific adenine glycosylase
MAREIQRIATRVVAWFAKNARELPWRHTRDPYAIWISEVMLQQTQVKTVIPYWERWMAEFPTVRYLAPAEEQRVLKLWEGLGYYTRARNLQKAARLICNEHSGEFPSDFDQVHALPGIGRYTAGAICSIAYGQATPILDGNVLRVLTRVFAISGDPKSKSNQERLWALSAQLVSAAAKDDACSALNQGLMELGATMCTPREPLCGNCPLRSTCQAFRTERIAEFPHVVQRAKPRQRRFVAFLFLKNDKVLVRKRDAEVVNGSLWEFPNYELKRGMTNPLTSWKNLEARPFTTIKHTITNNRITLQASTAEVNGEASALAKAFSAEWRALADLEQLPFSSAHGRLRSMLRRNLFEA